MTTTVVRYVDPDSTGGNGTTSARSGANAAYSSLGAWNAARQRNLVNADEIEKVICCSGDAAHTADTALTFMSSTWTCDANRYVWITTDTASRATATWSDSKYRIVNVSYDSAIYIGYLSGGDLYLLIDGLQIKNTSTGTHHNIRWIYASASTSWVKNCHLWIDGASRGISMDEGSSGTLHVWNTVINGAGSTCYGAWTNDTDSTMNLYNVTFDGCSTSVYGQAGTINCTNCGSSNTSDDFNSVDSTTTCSTTDPTYVDRTNRNFHLADADTAWKDAGTDLSATLAAFPQSSSDDIDGETRPTGASTWDIGADEYFPGPISINVSDCANPVCIAWQ